MKNVVLGLAAATLVAGAAFAQTTPARPNPASNPPTTATPATAMPATSAPTTGAMTTPPPTGAPMTNQAATSTPSMSMPQRTASTDMSTNHPGQPVSGANSFTQGEAQSRFASNGFSQVSGLKKDDKGVWRGHAQKNGQQVNVWLDYKGNVGQN